MNYKRIMKPSHSNSDPDTARRRLATYAHAFAQIDQALAKHTKTSELTDVERLRWVRRQLFGKLPEDQPKSKPKPKPRPVITPEEDL